MARSNSKPSNSALELPDPYGQGFERIEDPLEKPEHSGFTLKGGGSYLAVLRIWVLIYWRSIVGLVLAFIGMLGIFFPEQIAEKIGS